MINLGVISPDPTDGSSFYRAFGVWPYVDGVRIIDGAIWGWDKISQCDALFIHRGWAKEHLFVAKQAKLLKVPIWVDYDDNLLELPLSNPAHGTYAKPDVRQNIIDIVGLADLVTVSTPYLGEEVFAGATVIPNAWNDYVWDMNEPGERKKVVTWRGTSTHFEDMEPYVPSIARVASDFPDWEFHFLGHPHWGVEHIPNARSHPFVDNLFGYMTNLVALNPYVHIVCLKDNPFNRSKSYVSAIEATLAGAHVIAPGFWDMRGLCGYDTTEQFESLLRRSLRVYGDPSVDSWWREAAHDISCNLRLSHVNEQRQKLLMGLQRKLLRPKSVSTADMDARDFALRRP